MKKILFSFLLLFHVMLHSDKSDAQSSSFTTNEIIHENGDRSVTYEHEGNNASGHYHYSATFEHDKYDTCERVALSNFTVGYTPHDPHDATNNVQASTQEYSAQENQHETPQSSDQHCERQNSSDSSWNRSGYEENANNRALDNHFDTTNDRISSQQNKSSSNPKDSQDDFPWEQYGPRRSAVYLWCKGIKEIFIGPSKKTIREEQAKIDAYKQETLQKKNAAEKLNRKRDALQVPVSQSQLEQAYDEHQVAIQSSDNKNFATIMQQRNLPFNKSLQHQTRVTQHFSLKNSTIGFMQAHNINHHQFTQLHGLAIQHQLTQELINNLNRFADIADKNFNNQSLLPMIQAGAFVSGMAQDYNQTNKLLDAISATNCSHGFLHYLQGMTLQTYDRCEKMGTALSFFNCEIAKYRMAAARGITKGIISSEIATACMIGIGKVAATIAPQLTASVYAGATTIMVPIAVVAGGLCALTIFAELGNLGYLYTTDQLEKLQRESERIANFAGQFYNFDQAPTAHVENLATLATTLVWPWQRETIFNGLMGMKQVYCNIYLSADKVMQHTQSVTSKQLHNALEYIKQPELTIFNIEYKKIFNDHIFDFYPKTQVALTGISEVISQQEIISLLPTTRLLAEQTNNTTIPFVAAVIGQVSKNPLGQQLDNKVELIVAEKVTANLIAQYTHETIKFQEILIEEIAREITIDPSLLIDLNVPINSMRAIELASLVPQIRQLQDLAKYTNNFINLENLILEDILYLNRIYELREYRSQIKNFLDIHKPFFIHEGQPYFIEDISSYHIHAGDYSLKDRPNGGHSNFGRHQLDYFSPQLIKNGPAGSKDVLLTNPRNEIRTKPSTIYSEDWSEYTCDLKAIEAMTSENALITDGDSPGTIQIIGNTLEGLEILIHYDIKAKKIKTHYPYIEQKSV